MTVDTRLIIDHSVKVVEGPYKGRSGRVVGLNFEIRNDPIMELQIKTMVATVLSGEEQFKVPVLWLE